MARVYESRTNRALVHIARKYCVLSRYVANNYINVFPANTFFNDAYQTISDIQFIATGRVAPVPGYKYIIGRAKRATHWGCSIEISRDICVSVVCQITWNHVNQTRACSKSVLGGKIRPVTPLVFIAANRPDMSGTLTISRLDPASCPTENFFYDLSRQSECPA